MWSGHDIPTVLAMAAALAAVSQTGYAAPGRTQPRTQP